MKLRYVAIFIIAIIYILPMMGFGNYIFAAIRSDSVIAASEGEVLVFKDNVISMVKKWDLSLLSLSVSPTADSDTYKVIQEVGETDSIAIASPLGREPAIMDITTDSIIEKLFMPGVTIEYDNEVVYSGWFGNMIKGGRIFMYPLGYNDWDDDGISNIIDSDIDGDGHKGMFDDFQWTPECYARGFLTNPCPENKEDEPFKYAFAQVTVGDLRLDPSVAALFSGGNMTFDQIVDQINEAGDRGWIKRTYYVKTYNSIPITGGPLKIMDIDISHKRLESDANTIVTITVLNPNSQQVGATISVTGLQKETQNVQLVQGDNLVIFNNIRGNDCLTYKVSISTDKLGTVSGEKEDCKGDDKDLDGVSNGVDKCPDDQGFKMYNGCATKEKGGLTPTPEPTPTPAINKTKCRYDDTDLIELFCFDWTPSATPDPTPIIPDDAKMNKPWEEIFAYFIALFGGFGGLIYIARRV